MHDIDTALQGLQSESFEYDFEESEWNEVLSDSELNELASELLAVTEEQELELFLGSLIKKVGQTVGKIAKSPVSKALGGMLKGVAKKALPIAGAALGNLVAPGVGGRWGALGSMAGKTMGLELEGLTQEDAELEVAKQFVRLASDATRSALTKADGNANPLTVARKAVGQAIEKHAPGLAKSLSANGPDGASEGREGRWVRKGSQIVLYGV